MTVTVTPADLADPRVAEIVAAHNAHCLASSPPGSCHFFTHDKLVGPDITVWTAWHDGELAGIGALQALGAGEGEVKSMHTLEAKRGLGVGAAILAAILGEAERRAYRRVSLETGSNAHFAAARALYARQGFAPCEPFGAYTHDPASAYFTKTLEQPEAVR